ncbi:MAG: class I SAM-dependent rRNA methyltransferase [Bacteroidetes bacterium]|nr:class I SAM-dependent rRNA methyltransferase [Bacteroidota bacterium]MCW5894997.1 class I SAM-dependent rRNA methyltransferase [Bacteroidota bacterium]
MGHLEKQIILKNKEEGRILSGHPWVFSNEIRETKGTPLIGDVVELLSAGGKTLGVGFYNPHSLISARLLSTVVEDIDQDFFRKRLQQALDLRKKLYPSGNMFRLAFSESDFLPGLIVDKFNEFLSVQTFSFGMDARLQSICDILESLLQPKGIIERNESPLRDLEKLPQRKGVLRGEAGCTIVENEGLRFSVDVLEGQKTGFFLDQRENRLTIRRFAPDAEVLDCFCNDGGFALHAADAGAQSVLGIDASADAVKRATANAALNQLTRVTFEQADVFDSLKKLHAEGRTFDVVVLDPPSFTKSKKNVQSAKQGYRELHAGVYRIIREGGILLTASCSHHIESGVFLDIIDSMATKTGRRIQLLDWRGAAPDHPVLPAMPETRYLKFAVVRVL